jgi:hypothetical protein
MFYNSTKLNAIDGERQIYCSGGLKKVQLSKSFMKPPKTMAILMFRRTKVLKLGLNTSERASYNTVRCCGGRDGR